MKLPFVCLFLLCHCLACITASAQDKIYLATEQKEGKVTEITSDKIRYKNALNPGPVYSISKNKVLFVFNSAGGYYLLNGDAKESESNTFLNQTQYPVTDVIITSDEKRIPCVVEKEENDYIHYSDKGGRSKIERGSVAAMIFKNGQHKILMPDFARVAAILQNTRGSSPVATQNVSAPAQNLIAPVNVIEKEVPVVSRETASVRKEEPRTENPVTVQPVSNITRVAENKPNTTREVSNEELGIDYKEYENKALQKTRELSDLIKILCDKNTEYDKADKAIDQSCLLFVNEDASVSVSSVNKQSSLRYKIREYLKKLKLIKYGRVEIEWTNIQYVSKLRQGSDGNFYGVISFEQTFRGYTDNVLIYSDKTRKNVEIVLKAYKKSIEGRTKTSWDVLLSDIGVIETKQSS